MGSPWCYFAGWSHVLPSKSIVSLFILSCLVSESKQQTKQLTDQLKPNQINTAAIEFLFSIEFSVLFTLVNGH